MQFVIRVSRPTFVMIFLVCVFFVAVFLYHAFYILCVINLIIYNIPGPLHLMISFVFKLRLILCVLLLYDVSADCVACKWRHPPLSRWF